jgi:hypothetical protein
MAWAEEHSVGGANLAQTGNTHYLTPNCQNKNE